MYVRLGLMSGEIVESDDYADDQLEALIAENDGRLGTDDWSRVRVENIDDALAFMARVIDISLDDRENGTINTEVNGQTLQFASSDVAWVRVVR